MLRFARAAMFAGRAAATPLATEPVTDLTLARVLAKMFVVLLSRGVDVGLLRLRTSISTGIASVTSETSSVELVARGRGRGIDMLMTAVEDLADPRRRMGKLRALMGKLRALRGVSSVAESSSRGVVAGVLLGVSTSLLS